MQAKADAPQIGFLSLKGVITMSNLIHGIHHVAIKYDGYETFQEALHFFCDLLGLKLARTWGEGNSAAAMIDTGSGLLEIFASGNGLPNGKIAHVALATDDVDKCIDIVRKAGYPITIEPKDIVIGSQPPYPARIGFCLGAGKEEVEFFCVK